MAGQLPRPHRHLRDAKGLHDLAVLLAQPGADLPALDLAGGRRAARHRRGRRAGARPRRAGGVPAPAGRARRRARRRAATSPTSPAGNAPPTSANSLLAELRRATRPGGASRALGTTTAERARKAVTARIRDAIRRIADVHPELGAHLDRTVRTGTTCRYEPDPAHTDARPS